MGLLDRLTPREEQVILLRMEAMKYREIAEALEITPQTVHVLIKRAVKKLRAAVEERSMPPRAARPLH
jgi:RNA polymerase sigma factor (sigma-70 family)